MNKKIILDTDIGGDIDDALCLAYLLNRPDCEIVGITAVGGEVERRAMVADAICKAAGKQVPVYAGADVPLMPTDMYPTPGGAVKLDRWPHDTAFKANTAVDFMRRTIRDNPHQITLVAIGHLTNVALLFMLDPEIPQLLKELYIMSGVFSEKLETELEMPMSNWNSWADAHASAVVYNTPVPVHRTFGLNVTTQLVLKRDDNPHLFSTGLMQAVEDFGSPWLEQHDMTFHDPLVGAALFEPQLCTYARGTIRVELFDQQRLGMMDFQPDDSSFAEIALTVDRKAFFEHYFAVTGAEAR